MPDLPSVYAKHEDGLEFCLQKLLILLPLTFIHLVAENERQRLQNVRVKPVYRKQLSELLCREARKEFGGFCFLESKD